MEPAIEREPLFTTLHSVVDEACSEPTTNTKLQNTAIERAERQVQELCGTSLQEAVKKAPEQKQFLEAATDMSGRIHQ